MPANPVTLDDLQEVSPIFCNTLAGDNFPLYDSYEDEDDNYDGGRFDDGTFRSSPTIFFFNCFRSWVHSKQLSCKKH